MKFGKFEKTYPITKLEDSGPIEFLIENATNHSLDLRQSYLHIKFKVAKSDGSNLAADYSLEIPHEIWISFRKRFVDSIAKI